MKKIIVEIFEDFAGALSITAIGSNYLGANVTVAVADLSDTNHIVIDEMGKPSYEFVEELK